MKSTKLNLKNAKLAAGHDGLIITVVKPMVGSGEGIPDDVLGAARLGLVEAAVRYDKKKSKFSTYAVLWIRAKVLAYYLRNFGPTSFGTTRDDRHVFFNLKKVKTLIANTLGEEAANDNARLAKMLKVDIRVVERVLPRLQPHDVALDAPFDDGDSTDRHETFGGFSTNPEEALIAADDERQRAQTIHNILASLSPRERIVIEKRYLDGEDQKTLREAGEALGVTRERARQIELRAFQKMRRAARRDAHL